MFLGIFRVRRKKHLVVAGLLCIILFLLYEIQQLSYIDNQQRLDIPLHKEKYNVAESNAVKNNEQDVMQPILNELEKDNDNFNDNFDSIHPEDISWELIEKFKVDYDDHFQPIVSPWDVSKSWVNSREIFPDVVPELGMVLKSMANEPVIYADIAPRGTQLKLLLVLKGGQKVLFKPKWFERDQVIEGPPYAGQDRHNGEIAAFHLSRILGFRRTPLTVGRYLNLQTEVIPVASSRLLDTFFYKDNDTCFYGKCYYCKGKESGVCAQKTVLEGTIVLWISHKMQLYRHPWGRTYIDNKQAKWETDAKFCDKVLQTDMYKLGIRLLDIIDTSVFDYIIGNADRHHYETFHEFPDSMVIMLDNGKSFGNPYHDEYSILAPLYQCCKIRQSTYDQLKMLKNGILSKVLEAVLLFDPISPILNKFHLRSIDRRLHQLLTTIDNCVKEQGMPNVIISDEKLIPEKHVET
ncbi:glycosaminoglycan xylosylkinase-like [Octopus sinensis]|uniref:Glycosaminoglycan xylosylkinase-like n=1 Tax=Octopus sinensis TaxID=2607531 RepID=A0A6P7SCI8_9MOLL|nr:glycosaminoglycan xylosylkinase-like [Octopus sinensis]XP_029635714.1 glycosaminoglycan xylosylkinase-like [Octopus sinensis]XP_036357407.1 glycosaminoglycan xylosylkinase-like [Octopus sinensis]XP_036357411.1 glycosaminoglycan xylosylkinase-like [Octopus sinensis]XP_036357419.1 glycosaminoglycan xylosylkinase-like [Octopus sinensis]XP_036357423.1 glycosaminoglycan xylosylkinase-like [Octopus sinensis]XP_036357425.1 glycosaminoglycan xylosylkinase-like [Octopus sinensis]